VASVDETLKRVPLFSALSQRQLRRLRGDFRERTFRPGAPILREGEMSGVDFFVIVEGEASVSVGGKEVDRLGPGDYFGELALIAERERFATVTAVEPVRCLSMKSWHFRKFIHDNPDVAWKLLQHVVGLVHADRKAPARAM
jgi:CRP/FNR family cyclic AMP-dependent transcriptional regulator